jgi:predicted transcriptional regulator
MQTRSKYRDAAAGGEKAEMEEIKSKRAAEKGIAKKGEAKKQKKLKAAARLLTDVPAEEFLSLMKGDLIDVKASESIVQAIQLLDDNRILGAPVYDATAKKHVGFVDMLDIVAAIVRLIDSVGDRRTRGVNVPRETDSAEMKEAQEELLVTEMHAKFIADLSNRDKWTVVSDKDNGLRVAEILTKHHRVGVEGADGKIRGIITQSQFCQFVYEFMPELLEKLRRKVKDLPLPVSIDTIPETSAALVAFRKMIEQGVSALGVVASNNRLVDVISVSDFMIWLEWDIAGMPMRFVNFEQLHMNIRDFLSMSRAQKKRQSHYGHPLSCKTTSTLEEAIHTMTEKNVHRLFVEDEDGVPRSILNYADIISAFIK